MSKMPLTAEQVLRIYPELKGFVSDGTTDFNRIAAVVGSREADLVWAVKRALTTPAVSKAQVARLARLKGIMSKS